VAKKKKKKKINTKHARMRTLGGEQTIVKRRHMEVIVASRGQNILRPSLERKGVGAVLLGQKAVPSVVGRDVAQARRAVS